MFAGVAVKAKPALVTVGAVIEMDRVVAAAAKEAFITKFAMCGPMVVGAGQVVG